MRMLRVIKGVRRDRIQNVQIREELNVVTWLQDKDRKKLHWYGHVKRINKEKKPKQSL